MKKISLSFSLIIVQVCFSSSLNCVFEGGYEWARLFASKYDLKMEVPLVSSIEGCSSALLKPAIRVGSNKQKVIFNLIRYGEFSFRDLNGRPQIMNGCVYRSIDPKNQKMIYCPK